VKLWVKITTLEIISAIIIVAATRAYVMGSYRWTTVLEVAFVTQWFWSRNIPFEDPRARTWGYGYTAYLVGAVVGTLAGLYVSMHLLGR
jgi:hypothetical protein